MKPKKPCNYIGCRELVDKGYCDKHKPETRDYDKHRYSSSKRGYDGRWRAFRVGYLKLNPLCFDCKAIGTIEPAVDVHHIIKLVDGGNRLDFNNCMALCHECHSVRTRRGE